MKEYGSIRIGSLRSLSVGRRLANLNIQDKDAVPNDASKDPFVVPSNFKLIVPNVVQLTPFLHQVGQTDQIVSQQGNMQTVR